jgi:hypothetical protein
MKTERRKAMAQFQVAREETRRPVRLGRGLFCDGNRPCRNMRFFLLPDRLAMTLGMITKSSVIQTPTRILMIFALPFIPS